MLEINSSFLRTSSQLTWHILMLSICNNWHWLSKSRKVQLTVCVLSAWRPCLQSDCLPETTCTWSILKHQSDHHQQYTAHCLLKTAKSVHCTIQIHTSKTIIYKVDYKQLSSRHCEKTTLPFDTEHCTLSVLVSIRTK